MQNNTAAVYAQLNGLGLDSYNAYTTDDWDLFAFSSTRAAYLLGLSQVNNTFTFDNRLQSRYPYGPVITNEFYLYAEMAYEFVLGTRIISKYFLDMCEVPVSEFFTAFQDATAYKLNIDSTEGFLRQLDTLLMLTPLAEACWQTYWRTGQSAR